MSYEGYEQWLCRSGHLHEFDCYWTPDRGEWRCPDCGDILAFSASVDVTNGSDPATGEGMPMEFTVKTPAPKCECCGQAVGPVVYEVPS
jgi:hypothetical protein